MDQKLYFVIDNQHINRVDKFEPVAKSKNYLYAQFEFITDEWIDKVVTVIFTKGDISYQTVLNLNNECLVPWEVLTDEGDIFVSVYTDNLITTNSSRVYIRKTGYTEDSENTEPPTPDIYTQLGNRIEEVQNELKIIDGGNFEDWYKES